MYPMLILNFPLMVNQVRTSDVLEKQVNRPKCLVSVNMTNVSTGISSVDRGDALVIQNKLIRFL